MACSLSVTGDVKVEHDWVDKVFTYRKRLDFKKVLLNADILLFYNSFPLFSKVVIMGVCMCVAVCVYICMCKVMCVLVGVL